MKLLEKIEETGGGSRKKGSGWPKFVRAEENIKLVEEMILSQGDQPGTHSTLAEVADELNIDRQSVSCIIDQDLIFFPWLNARYKILLIWALKSEWSIQESYCKSTSQTAFFSNEKIFKVKKLYNSQNDMV